MIATRNDAYERVAKRSDVRFVTMDDYRIFHEVGLRGLAPDGTERPARATGTGYATRCSPIFPSPPACVSKRRRACSPMSSRPTITMTIRVSSFGCAYRRRSPTAIADAVS